MEQIEDIGEITHKKMLITEADTGVVIREFYQKIKKDIPLVKFDNKSNAIIPTLKFNKGKQFVKLYSNEILPDYKSDNFLIYWLKLSKKLSESTNIICIARKGNKGNEPMTKQDMINMLKVSDRTFKEFLKESITKFIIVEDNIQDGIGSRVQYVMNPLYCFNGNNLNYYTYEMFKRDPLLQKRISEALRKDIIQIETELEDFNQNVILKTT